MERYNMNEIMVIAKLKLNNEQLLGDWKILSEKIDTDLAGVDGFISRDSLQGEDGTIYCVLKWESKSKQEKFMEELMSRTSEESQLMMEEFGRVVNIESLSKDFFEVL